MNLVCPRCRARLSVAADRVLPPEGRRGRCNQCGGTFLVRPPKRASLGEGMSAEAIQLEAAAPRPREPASAPSLHEADDFEESPMADSSRGTVALPPGTPAPLLPSQAARASIPSAALAGSAPARVLAPSAGPPAPPPSASTRPELETEPLAPTVHATRG